MFSLQSIISLPYNTKPTVMVVQTSRRLPPCNSVIILHSMHFRANDRRSWKFGGCERSEKRMIG